MGRDTEGRGCTSVGDPHESLLKSSFQRSEPGESIGRGLENLRGSQNASCLSLAEIAVCKLGAPSLPIVDVLRFYIESKQPKPNASKAMREAAAILGIHCKNLIIFWRLFCTRDVRGETCRDYVAWRTHMGTPKPKWPDRMPRPANDQTARRELVVLSAALNLYHKEYGLDRLPIVTLPVLAPSKRKALTHNEAASLLAGALGFYRHDNGKVCRRQKSTRSQRKRTARFILIGLYSGTRHSSILAASWVRIDDGPWIDVEQGILHRRGDAEIETRKRRPPARIPPRLLAHLRRWRKMDMENDLPVTHVIARNGERLAGKLRTGWAGARRDAGLNEKVVPHVLRHTAGTWLAQGGIPTREAADFLGVTEAQFETTYYSAHPDFQAAIGPAFDAAKRRENKAPVRSVPLECMV